MTGGSTGSTGGDLEYDPRYDDYTSEEYPPDWDGRRRAVLDRDDYTCQRCGIESTRVDDVRFDVDHVVPKSEGGSHRLSNLQTLCPACHAEKHGDNAKLNRRAREFRRRNRPSVLWRLLRVVLVVPVVLSALGDDRTVVDEDGRKLTITPLEDLSERAVDEGVTVEVRVATLWDAGPDAIAQKGLLAPADSTREEDVPLVQFVVWADAGVRRLERDGTYRVVGARVGEFDGDRQVQLDRQTAVVPIDPD